MEGTAKINGLKDAMRALQAAFPNNAKQRQRIVNGAMGGAARKTLLPIAKQMAKTADGSGSLSEALAVRAKSKRQRKGRAGGMAIVPVRSNRKALALYIAHYFTSKGKNAPAGILASGIRHGHLVEFGSLHNSAKPFLWPAAAAATPQYTAIFAVEMKKRIESAVKRAAKKRVKK